MFIMNYKKVKTWLSDIEKKCIEGIITKDACVIL